MAGKYKFSEVELEEIRAARRGNTNKRAETRLKALELRAMGKSNKEVGAVTGFHPAYITTKNFPKSFLRIRFCSAAMGLLGINRKIW